LIFTFDGGAYKTVFCISVSTGMSKKSKKIYKCLHMLEKSRNLAPETKKE